MDNKTFYALRYPMIMPPQPKMHEVNPDAPKPEGWHPAEYWYEKKNAGRLVALDRASGGYAYPTERFGEVQLWETEEKADSYRQVCNREKFEMVKVTISFEDVTS